MPVRRISVRANPTVRDFRCISAAEMSSPECKRRQNCRSTLPATECHACSAHLPRLCLAVFRVGFRVVIIFAALARCISSAVSGVVRPIRNVDAAHLVRLAPYVFNCRRRKPERREPRFIICVRLFVGDRKTAKRLRAQPDGSADLGCATIFAPQKSQLRRRLGRRKIDNRAAARASDLHRVVRHRLKIEHSLLQKFLDRSAPRPRRPRRLPARARKKDRRACRSWRRKPYSRRSFRTKSD